MVPYAHGRIRAVTHYGIEPSDMSSGWSRRWRGSCALATTPVARRTWTSTSGPDDASTEAPGTGAASAGGSGGSAGRPPRGGPHPRPFRRAHDGLARPRLVLGHPRLRRRCCPTCHEQRSRDRSRPSGASWRASTRSTTRRLSPQARLREGPRGRTRPGGDSSKRDVQRGWERHASAAEEVGDALFVLLARDFATLEERLGSMVERLEAAPGALLASRDRLGERPVRLWNEMELATARDLPLLIDEIEAAARGVWAEDALDRRRLGTAAMRTKAALEEHSRWLVGRLARAEDDVALGKAAFDTLVGLRAFDGLDTRADPRDRPRAARGPAPGAGRRPAASSTPTSTRRSRSTA